MFILIIIYRKKDKRNSDDEKRLQVHTVTLQTNGKIEISKIVSQEKTIE